jgi:hypothetical protein
MSKANILFVALVSLLVMSLSAGCVSAPPKKDMIKLIENYKLPASNAENPDMALVYVVRPAGVGTLVRFNVYVDDPGKDNLDENPREAGYTRGTQHIWFFVEPGEHTICSVAENRAELKLFAEAGKTYFIKQNVQMGAFVARNSVEFLDDVEGTYWVKETRLGTIKKKVLKGVKPAAPAAPPVPAAPPAPATPPAPPVPATTDVLGEKK